ncbi:MAG: T9SS type A sorting domain-containing protein [Candidatus Marinimicrobia bacterium]|nr:T9SS type A sorting domain-containing protein [Candidatus Neomarinimicrobiota bacterium]
MKKFLMTVLLLTLLVSFSFAQWEVVKQESIPFQINAGTAIDANTVVLVGDDGEVLKTVDGGASWPTMRAADGSGYDWEDVKFADANVGYATSEKGFIYKTVDGGATWTMIADTANFSVTLKHLAVVSADIVYFAGKDGVLLKTVDGGVNFTKSDSTFDGDDLDGGIAFCSENVGVVQPDGVGGKTWYTHDGGQTWTFVTVASLFPIGLTSSRIYDVTAYGDSTFAIVGYHYCTFLSTDGGKTYSYIGNVNYGYELGVSIDIIDDNTIIIGGNDGYVAKTTDAGASWDTLKVGHGHKINIVDFVDANTGYVFGYYGQWMKTIDGGANFTPLLDWPQVSFWGLALPEENKIVLSTYSGGELATSIDGGLTWDYPNNYATGTSENLYECEFFDVNTGLAGGGYGTLIRTADGGATWTAIESPMALATNKHINAIHVFDATTAFAGGSSGYLMKSTDGGLTWTDTKVNSSTVYDIWALDANTVLASESSGKFCYGVFDASGAVVTDSLLIDVGSNSMRAIEVRNNVVIVPASKGKIFRAALDRLDTLAAVFTDPDGDDLYDVEFVDDNLVFVVGEAGKIYRSDDAGLTWTADPAGATETLQKVRYDGTNLWAVGKGGTILKRELNPMVTFQVNMSAQIDLGNFVPGTDYLDVAGSFNGWGASDSLSDADGDSIYTITLEIPEGAIEYKFRFNGTWDTCESISNRQYTVVAGENVLPVVWYNDFDPASSVNAEVYFYVDMNIQLLNKNFQPDSGNIVIIRGGFNGWSGEDNELTLDPSVTGLYVAAFKMDNLSLDAANEFKFVIHYGPNDDAWEGSPNRSFTIPTGHTYEDFDNDGYYEVPTDTAFFANVGWDDIIQQDVTVYFNVDILSAVKALNAGEVLIDSQTDADTIYSADEIVGVYINGLLGSWWSWGINPAEFAMLDDGTNGDATADDGIYTLGILFTAGQAKEQLYKYGINSLDNEAGFAENRSVKIDDASSTFYPETDCYGSQNLDDRLPFPEYDCTEVGIDNEAYVLPDRFILHRNYPNPFNPTTNIAFEMPITENVKLEVYNILGHKVKTMQSGTLNAGFHVYEWNATNDAGQQMAAGVYIYRLTTAKKTLQKKLVLLK